MKRRILEALFLAVKKIPVLFNFFSEFTYRFLALCLQIIESRLCSALAVVFIFWIIVSVGMKFEVKIHGKEYGVSVGGPDKNEHATLKYLQMTNAFCKVYYSWADRFIIDLPDRDNCIRFAYPRYSNVEILGASENGRVFFIIYREKNILSIDEAYGMGIAFSDKRSDSYTVL